jgi:hypothetical protein
MANNASKFVMFTFPDAIRRGFFHTEAKMTRPIFRQQIFCKQQTKFMAAIQIKSAMEKSGHSALEFSGYVQEFRKQKCA